MSWSFWNKAMMTRSCFVPLHTHPLRSECHRVRCCFTTSTVFLHRKPKGETDTTVWNLPACVARQERSNSCIFPSTSNRSPTKSKIDRTSESTSRAAICRVSSSDGTSGPTSSVGNNDCVFQRRRTRVCPAHDEPVVERCVGHPPLRQDISKTTRQARCCEARASRFMSFRDFRHMFGATESLRSRETHLDGDVR